MEPVIQTFTGKIVNPLKLKVEDISIIDIAHHLSCINRFVGALRIPVNVAHHSVYVYKLCRFSVWKKEALFHDATEAYLGDVTKWLKQSPEMKGYRDAEQRAWDVICKALNLTNYPEHGIAPIVKDADNLMVRYEAMKLASKSHPMFEVPGYSAPTKEEQDKVGFWVPSNWQVSRRDFLDAAMDLGYAIDTSALR